LFEAIDGFIKVFRIFFKAIDGFNSRDRKSRLTLILAIKIIDLDVNSFSLAEELF
jgi:hypothetical protein